MTGKSEEPASIAPGEPPRVSSQVSSTLIEAGQSVSDRLDISGLTGPGTVDVTLYGPVPPVSGEGCAGVDWSNVGALPVARATVTTRASSNVAGVGTRIFDLVTVSGLLPGRSIIRVDGNGTFPTPSVRVTRPGCYSFDTIVTHTR